MSKTTKATRTTDPVSTTTKHIKIYSDNPIHDCIDRIIEHSTMLDAANTDKEYHLSLLREAAEDLSDICVDSEYRMRLIGAQKTYAKS
jgi:hypothetical protein